MELNNIELITSYGTITLNGEITGNRDNFTLTVDDYEFSGEAANIIGRVYEASQLFFVENIDITDEELDDDVIDELIDIISSTSYSDVSRALAIKQFSGDDFSEIIEHSSNEFTIGSAEYLVLDDDEATIMAEEGVKNSLDDTGLEGFSEYARDYAAANFIDTEWFDDAMLEASEGYAQDIQYESAEEPYINRLHKEMVELGVMDEPEWPEEPEEDDYVYEREDFNSHDIDAEEPLEDDFDDEDEFLDAYSTWEDEKSAAETGHNAEEDRLEEEGQEEYDKAYEEWETATEEYRAELEDEIESNITEFAEKRIEGEDGYDWWTENMGSEDQVIKDNGLLDDDAFAEWIISEDGRGAWIAYYDYEENEETVTYRGETETYYIYRRG